VASKGTDDITFNVIWILTFAIFSLQTQDVKRVYYFSLEFLMGRMM